MKIEPGYSIPPWDMPSVLPERMRTMAAILRDPYPVHWDSRVVEKMGLGRRTINQGPLGLSYMVNMLHEWMGCGSIKRLHTKFLLYVFEGDHVVAGGRVIAIREENGERLADCDIWLDRINGEDRPLEGSATVLLNE